MRREQLIARKRERLARTRLQLYGGDLFDAIIKGEITVRLRVVRREAGWFVTGLPRSRDLGPYTKQEADGHKRGLQRTYDNLGDRSFFTSEKLRRRLRLGKRL